MQSSAESGKGPKEHEFDLPSSPTPTQGQGASAAECEDRSGVAASKRAW